MDFLAIILENKLSVSKYLKIKIYIKIDEKANFFL